MQRTMDDIWNKPPERLHGRAAQKHMLEVLKRGPLSKKDAEADAGCHRGQRTIGELRDMGVQIVDQRISGVMCYVLLDANATLMKVPASTSAMYYASPHWRKLSPARIEYDGFMCVQCKATNDLHAHHWVYNLFAEDMLTDLVTLCHVCHKRLHETVTGCSFPRYMDKDLLKRIREQAHDANNHPDSSVGSPEGADAGRGAAGCTGNQGQGGSDQNADEVPRGVARGAESGG